MRAVTFLLGILFAMSISAGGLNLSNPLPTSHRIKFVQEMPANTQSHVLVLSTRNFNPEENYSLKRGLPSRYELFQFIAGIAGDSVFVMPVKNIAQVAEFFPKDRNFLVFVDGLGKTFNQILERGFEITDRFHINMVIFDWPTDYQSVKETILTAEEVSGNFVLAMKKLKTLHKKYYPTSTVSAIFHSMGNYIIKNVTSKPLLNHMPLDLFSNLILNAASVKQNNHARWVEKLNIQQRIYITLNSDDRTLKGARLLQLTGRLGLGFKGSKASNAIYVDISQVALSEHTLFLGKTEAEKNNQNIYRFYDQAFHGKEVNFSNELAYQIFNPSEICFLFSPSDSALESP